MSKCIIVANPEQLFENWTPEQEGVDGIYSADYVAEHPEDFSFEPPQEEHRELPLALKVFVRPGAQNLEELPGALPSRFVFLDDLLAHLDEYPESIGNYYTQMGELAPKTTLFISETDALTVFRR